MRTIFRSEEFDEYYALQPARVRGKIDYALSVLEQIKVVNTKLVKSIENTDFYELRISVDNEHRVLMFSIDHDNIIEATQILLLNGFIKKSTKDYKSQILIAEKILQKYTEQ